MIPTSATPSQRAILGRRTTAVDAVAERYLATYAALDPCAATEMGIVGHDGEYETDITDYSPDGVAARADAARAAMRELDEAAPEDDVDVVTLAAMRERLGVQLDLHDAGLDVGELNVIASPLQSMRDVFDLMPTDTDDEWRTISERLSRVPDRVDGYATALRATVATGHPPAVRQVARGIEQSSAIQQLFVDMVADAASDNDALHADLQARASAAADAYSGLAAVLRDEVGPHARGDDAFGRDAYRLFSRLYLGAEVDLDETYEWGLDLLQSIVAEQESIAHRLYPESTVAEALSRLDEEPRYLLEGVDTLQNWMQELSDRVVDALADTHFEIAEPLRRLECCIAPTQTGGIYYTGPSEDLSRPGRMWWSVPPGVDDFPYLAARPPPSSTRASPVTTYRSAGPSCLPIS